MRTKTWVFPGASLVGGVPGKVSVRGGSERFSLSLESAHVEPTPLRRRCLKRRHGRLARCNSDSRAWSRTQSDGGCSCAGGGGTVTCPTGNFSSRSSRRALVRAQYLG